LQSFKFGNEVGTAKAKESNFRKTTCKIGETFYNVDISKIPYFWAAVGFERLSPLQSVDFNHEDIALFDVALRDLESGYRECFCSLSGDISQYHTLRQTYFFLRVDVLAGQSIDDILADLRAWESDFGLEDESAKSQAWDAAFRPLFLIIRGEFGDEKMDSVKVFDAVLLDGSHPDTFKQGTRTVVQLTFEESFAVTIKQRREFHRWRNEDVANSSGDENMAEDESDDAGFPE
jgi:hypothetical protein